MTDITCDICVIGAGAAGLSLVAGATGLGANVVLIEKYKMGGECLNYGCVPSKALLSIAKNYYLAKKMFDIAIELDFTSVMTQVNQIIDSIAPNDSTARFESLGATVIHDEAKFISPTIIQTTRGDNIHARRIVIATGSKPMIPPEYANLTHYTNESIFDITTLPKQLLIIGGGPIACEMAQAFAMLGSNVSIVSRSGILPRDEVDCSQIILNSLLKIGIQIYTNSKVETIQEISQHNFKLTITNDTNVIQLTASHILIATGRTANIENLNLDLANIEYNNKGIIINNKLQTNNKHIYAIGDCTGGYQFTHRAGYHAGIALTNILLRIPLKAKNTLIPWVTYTYPEIAHIGMSETEAREHNSQIKVIDIPYNEVDRAITDNKQVGKIKVIIDKNQRMLGVTIVGDSAGELIVPWIILIQQKQKLKALTQIIIPYPTLSEISKKVANKHYSSLFFSPFVKKIVHILQKLG